MRNSNLKIAYLGKTQLSDIDISYIHSAQKIADISYIVEVSPRYLKGAAIDINNINSKTGIYKATDIYYDAFVKFKPLLDLNKVYVANSHGKWWMFRSIITNFKLLFFLIKNEFDVIHITWPLNIYEFPLFFLRKRMILSVHDPIPHTGGDTFIVRIRRYFSFKFIRYHILFNNAQIDDYVSTYKISKNRLIISRLSCYTYLLSIPTNYSLKEHNKYILFFGRISPYKGLDYLFPAMIEINKTFPDVKLIVAGSGKYSFNISQYKSKEFIVLINKFIPDTDLVGLIKNSLFIICPYTDATQSGVIMSAFAFNKPVIATNVGGLPEMVINNVYGEIIPAKNEHAIYNSISKWLNNPELVKTYSNNIKRDYHSGEKSWDNISRKLLNDIKRCIKS